jgi:hypothetical protein
MPIGIRTQMPIFLECLIVSTDDTTAATAGNGDFGTSPFFGGSQASHNLLVTILGGVSDAKAQGPDREIRRRIIYLPSGRVSPASIAKSEFRPVALYVSKSPNALFVAGQQNGGNWGNGDAASIDGINLRDGLTAKLDGLSGEERLRKATVEP